MIGSRMIYNGQPGGSRYYAHRIVPYDVKAGDPPRELTVALRPGKTVSGRLIGPEGQPVEKAEIITTLLVRSTSTSTGGVTMTIHARDGSFDSTGSIPIKTLPCLLPRAEHERGTTVELSGK